MRRSEKYKDNAQQQIQIPRRSEEQEPFAHSIDDRYEQFQFIAKWRKQIRMKKRVMAVPKRKRKRAKRRGWKRHGIMCEYKISRQIQGLWGRIQGELYKMEAARVAVSLKPGTRKNVKRCPVLNLEAIEMVRGGPPRMREEAGDGNFKLQIKKLGHF